MYLFVGYEKNVPNYLSTSSDFLMLLKKTLFKRKTLTLLHQTHKWQMALIDQDSVQKVIERADIVEVVGDYVSLKKRGQNYLGLCPFHNEKTPSFIVSPAKGIYKCFGCGAAGNSVKFVMDHEKISFPEAIKTLANKYHIEIVEQEMTDEQKQSMNERDSMMLVTAFAQKYFTEILHTHEEGKAIGLSYLQERNISPEMIARFQLGYCPDTSDGLTTAAKNKGFKTEFLIKTGLTAEKNNYRYDKFRARVIFPIHNLSGKVIGFGGRTLKNDKKTAKYLNSPESEIYHKSNVLYGLFFAKSHIVRLDKCYMVEGYTDVISMHQAGIENVVASSGTSLTENQIKLIKRFTPNLTVVYDGDPAGIKASLRGINMVLKEGMNVRVIPLPEGEDPDSFSKSMSTAQLQSYFDEREESFITFKAKLLGKEAQNDPIKKAQLANDIVSSIAIIPNRIERDQYIKACASIVELPEESLYYELRKKLNAAYSKEAARQNLKLPENKQLQNTQATEQADTDLCYRTERDIIKLLLEHSLDEISLVLDQTDEFLISVANFIVSEITNDDFDFSTPVFKRFFDIYKANPEVNPHFFLNHEDAEISEMSANLLSSKYSLSPLWSKEHSLDLKEVEPQVHVPKIVLVYKSLKVKKESESVGNAIKTATEPDEIRNLLQKKMKLDELKKMLSAKLNRIVS